jgi:hypothetical protein
VIKKFLYLILACATAAGISACNGPGKPGSNNAVGAPESIPGTTPQSQAQAQGTGDSGGGNLYKGKPLESYIKDPYELTAVKMYVTAITWFLPNHISRYISQTLRAKTWYFVPGPLQDLPKERIGSQVNTEQAALQDFNQVWIDQTRFETMSQVEQAQLIVHEALMGLKLLKFDSPQNVCVLRQTYLLRTALRSYAKPESCASLSKSPAGKIADLTVTDYAQIRDLSAALIRRIVETEALSNHSLTWYDDRKNGSAALMLYYKFNETPWPDLFSANDFSFQSVFMGRQPSLVPMLDTLNLLTNSLAMGYKPSHAFDVKDLDQRYPGWKRQDGLPAVENKWTSSDRCNFEVKKDESNNTFQIIFAAKGIVKNYLLAPTETGLGGSADSNFWFNNEVFEKRTILLGTTIPKLGEKTERLIAYFDSQKRIRYVEYSEVFYEGLTGFTLGIDKTTWSDNYLKGPLVMCGLESELNLTAKKAN